MFNYYVVDDLAPPGMRDHIENTIMRGCNWHYGDSATGLDSSERDPNNTSIKESAQFVDLFYDMDEGVHTPMNGNIAVPLLWFLEDKTGLQIRNLYRIKANLLLPNGSEEHNYTVPHIDHGDPNAISMVYYVNDSDGDTVVFQNHVSQGFHNLEILHSNKPKKGSSIIFPSTQFHSSSNPITTNKRVIINFVFTVDELSYNEFIKRCINE